MGVLRRAALAAAAQLVLLALCANASASVACPTDSIQPTAATTDDAATTVLCDLNAQRADNGLRPLRWDGRLASAASGMAADMAARHYMSHVTPDGVDLPTRVAKTGYIPADDAWTVAENLAWGTNLLATPGAIVDGWMNSAPHRENVLDPDLEDVGIGIAPGAVVDGGQVGMIYVADFGRRGTPAVDTVLGSTSSNTRPQARKSRAHRKHRRHRKHRVHRRTRRR